MPAARIFGDVFARNSLHAWPSVLTSLPQRAAMRPMLDLRELLLRRLLVLRDHRARARRVDEVGLEEREAPVEQRLRGLVLRVVVVGEQLGELALGTAAGLAAEQRRELVDRVGALRVLLDQRPRVRAGRGDREHLG